MQSENSTIAEPGARYRAILDEVHEAHAGAKLAAPSTELIAVTKTHEADAIRPVLEAGCRVFGENRVQEAAAKWPALRDDYPDIELHLIGPLQSNKAAQAVALFDIIQSVDRPKIAKALAEEMEKQGRHIPVLIQVNTGLEPQKAGVVPYEVPAFVDQCVKEHGLDVRGLMCIPPFDENPGPHFALLRKLAEEANLPVRSMGMSGDYKPAIEFGATHVRVGSAIFGSRQ
ncbi:MAG: YggS family pyridoxal phosphate-dependent enzyme [Pseudomonadota bacterium]